MLVRTFFRSTCLPQHCFLRPANLLALILLNYLIIGSHSCPTQAEVGGAVEGWCRSKAKRIKLKIKKAHHAPFLSLIRRLKPDDEETVNLLPLPANPYPAKQILGAFSTKSRCRRLVVLTPSARSFSARLTRLPRPCESCFEGLLELVFALGRCFCRRPRAFGRSR